MVIGSLRNNFKHECNSQVINLYLQRYFNPRPVGDGAETDPNLNPKIFPKLKQISTPNLSYLSEQQCHTLRQKIRSHIIIGELE